MTVRRRQLVRLLAYAREFRADVQCQRAVGAQAANKHSVAVHRSVCGQGSRRLSITTGWQSRAASPFARRRAWTSVPRLGGNGTMIESTFVGKSAAKADSAPSRTRRSRTRFLMLIRRISPTKGIRSCDYGEVRMVPFAPTITSCAPDQTTPDRVFAVPDACCVHVTPSDEVTMVPVLPDPPTATNCVPDQVTPNRLFVVPEVRVVHVIPSGEVTMVPPFPTATNCVPY